MLVESYLRNALTVKIPGDFTAYFDFIESRPLMKKGSRSHRHHILPQKEFPSFKSDARNRCTLSFQDHLLAHYYLALCAPFCASFQLAFYAVTGTSRGMTQGQQDQARDFLRAMFVRGYRRLRHGDCIGSDAQFARIAKELGYYVICHPGHPPKKPMETKYRAFTDFNDEVLPAKEFIKRDHDMVDFAKLLLAAPYQDYEVQRSGTWATVRYAQSKGVTCAFVYPGRNHMSSVYAKRAK